MESTAKVLWGSQKPPKQVLISLLFLKRGFSLLFIYLFFDPIKLGLSVCSLCVRFSVTCFFIENYEGWVGVVCVCAGGVGVVVSVFWVKIGPKFDYIICEFVLFNNILWFPKICANEES